MNYLKRIVPILIVLVTGFSCNQEDDVVLPQAVITDDNTNSTSLNQEMSNQVEVSIMMNQIRSLGFGAPGGIMQGDSRLNGRQEPESSWARSRLMMRNETDDDGICVKETSVLKDDGTVVWYIDFGDDGCTIDGEFWKGRVIETYRENEETGEYTELIAFENFGQEDWTLNGEEAVEGTYTEDSVNGFSAEFTFVRNLQFVEVDEQWTVEQIGREQFTELAWTVLEQASSIEYQDLDSGTVERFENLVVEPLVMDFACEEQGVFTFVSGVEQVRFIEGDEQEEATILFGDGECDNIIAIVQEGVTVIIDLDEFNDEDEDEDEENDDTEEDNDGDEGEDGENNSDE